MGTEDHMNLSINGQSQVPPGFRFHPTEEELLHYYLRKKVAFERIDLDVIREVDLNKLEPWDIQEKCKIGSTPQNDWYFFSHKDKKYPTGTRTNRATAAGFWKATGRDKIIYSGIKRIGLRKTLVFYKGRAPHGQKSDWIMHEYRLDESTTHETNVSSSMGESMGEDGWVVCRVFKKKNYQKALESPKASYSMDSNSQISPSGPRNDHGVLDQILLYMGRTCKLENNESLSNLNMISERFMGSDHHALHDRFMHLPRLESPSTLPTLSFDHHHHHHEDRSTFRPSYQAIDEMLIETDHHHHQHQDHHLHHEPSPTNQPSGCDNNDPFDEHVEPKTSRLNDWATLERLVASQLNGQEDQTSKHLSCFGDPNMSTFCASPPHPINDIHDHDVQLSYPYLRSSRISSHNQSQVYNSDNDLWSFTKSSSSPSSSSDPLCHLSV